MPSPCPPPGKTYAATNGRNNYDITVEITELAWMSLPVAEQELVINILNATPINVMASLASTGNGIKRESNGWSIHTQTNKSLYDTNITKGDAGKKSFKFDSYKKRPH